MREKILLIDDQGGVLVGLEIYLSHFNINVDQAANVVEAINLIKINSYPVVITDLKLNNDNNDEGGFEIAEFIKKYSPKTKILLVTAFGSSKIQDRVDEIGIDDYLEKPLFGNDIIKALKELGMDIPD